MTKYDQTKAIKLTPELSELWGKAKAAYEGKHKSSLTFQRLAEEWVRRGCEEILKSDKNSSV